MLWFHVHIESCLFRFARHMSIYKTLYGEATNAQVIFQRSCRIYSLKDVEKVACGMSDRWNGLIVMHECVLNIANVFRNVSWMTFTGIVDCVCVHSQT